MTRPAWTTGMTPQELLRSFELSSTRRQDEQIVDELVALAEQAARWLAWSGGDYPDDSPGDVIHAEADGTITLDDGIVTWNPKRDRKSTRLNSSHIQKSRMPSSA